MALTQISTQGIKDGTITGSDLATNVDLLDNQKLRFGTGNDLQIYHDGSHSRLVDSGTGFLVVQSSRFQINNADNTENMAAFIENGAVELYHDNSKKFATFSNGSTVFGDFFIDNQTNSGKDLFFDESGNILKHFDGVKSVFGDGNDLQIYHDGTHSNIDNATNELRIESLNQIRFNTDDFRVYKGNLTEFLIRAVGDGSVELYHNGSKKFETTSTGLTVTGNIFPSANDTHALGGSSARWQELNISDVIDISDNGVIRLGNSDDLQIYHTGGANSYIRNTANNLYLLSTNSVQIGSTDSNLSNQEISGKFFRNGSVELYYDNSKKFETTSGGVNVTGNVKADGIRLDDNDEIRIGTGDDLKIYHTGSVSFIDDLSGTDIEIRANDIRLQTKANVGAKSALNCIADGAVELFHNNSKKFETTSDGVKISGAEGVEAILTFEPDEGDNASDKFRFRASDSAGFFLENGSSNDTSIKVNFNAGVELYHTNSKKFNTLSDGVHVHGQIQLNDNGKLNIGDSDDLQIYHDGSDSYILDNGSGHLNLKTNGSEIILTKTPHETMARFIVDGAVELFHNNSRKFATVSSGNHSYGQMTFDGRIYPNTDNAHTCGLSNRRWTEVCAVNGSINTSDKTEKNTIVESDLGLDFINKLKPISFKWNKDDGKTHYGLIVQDIEETILSLGKSIADFGGISKEEDSPMGLGYCELISPLIKAIQELSTEVASLKAS